MSWCQMVHIIYAYKKIFVIEHLEDNKILDTVNLALKLYGSLRDLWCTIAFIEETEVSIWQTRRRRGNKKKFN